MPAAAQEDDARPASHRRRWLALFVAALAGPLLAELGLRWLLFGDGDGLSGLRSALRQPELYADSRQDEDYWKLRWRWTPPAERRPAPVFDPDLGWVYRMIAPGTYAHRDERHLGGRRPLLLFGASFAGCETEKSDCFQGLSERSELAEEFCVLNYGIGGYGFDQMVLLMERVLDRFADRDPLVVFAPVVDTDLERSLMSFRSWPKACLRLEEGALVPGPPVAEDVDALLAAHPPAISSYAWRLFLYGTPLVPAALQRRLSGEEARCAELERLVDALVVRLHDDLDARGIPHFFLLFHSRGAVRPERPAAWQEVALVQALRRAGVPWVTSLPRLRAAAEERACPTDSFYFLEGKSENHLNVEGNRIVFQALLDGVRGRFDG